MADWNCPPRPCRREWVTQSIVVTIDTYGHLFPRGDDGSELADAEKVLLA